MMPDFRVLAEVALVIPVSSVGSAFRTKLQQL